MTNSRATYAATTVVVLITSGFLSFARASEEGPKSTLPQLSRPATALGSKSCADVMSGVQPHHPAPTSDQHEFFNAFNLMYSNSSYQAFGNLAHYKGLSTLGHLQTSMRNIDTRKNAGEKSRKQRAIEFYKMFEQAAAVGEDHVLASFFANVDQLTQETRSQLFFLGARKDNPKSYDSYYEHVVLSPSAIEQRDAVVATIRSSWQRLSTPQQTSILEWIGLMVSEDAERYVTTTIRFNHTPEKIETEVSSKRMLPALKQTLADYLDQHRSEGRKSDLTKAYYREIGSKILRIYGVETERHLLELPAPSEPGASGSLVDRVKGLIKQIRRQ